MIVSILKTTNTIRGREFLKYQENKNLQWSFAFNYNGHLGVLCVNWARKDKLSLTYQNLTLILKATVCVVLSSTNPNFSKLTT